MKGARRTRKPRLQAGFADLMAPPHPSTNMRGVVTGFSHAQPTVSTPNQTTPNPTTPPPPDEDWGSLLQTTPKRRMSPQKPIVATTPSSSSSTPISPPTAPQKTLTTPLALSPSPPIRTRTPPPQNSVHSASDQQPTNTASPSTATAVPAFLSGWDGAQGWGDDPSLDDSDQDNQDDPWGAWPESDEIFSAHTEVMNTVSLPEVPPEQSSSQKLEQSTEAPLDLGTPSISGPSLEQPDQPEVPDGESATNLSSEDTADSPTTSPANPTEEKDPLDGNRCPQILAQNESCGDTADREKFKADSDDNPTTGTDEGDLLDLKVSVEGHGQSDTSETLSEYIPLHNATNAASERCPEDPPQKAGVSDESKPDSCLETDDFSGWNEVHVAQEASIEFSSTPSQGIQSEQKITTEETKLNFEPQEDLNLQRHDAQDQVRTLVQTETKGDTMGLDGVAGNDTEVHRDPDTTVTSAVASTDHSHESPYAPLPTNAWGFKVAGEEVPVDEAGWGWEETDTAALSNVDVIKDTQSTSGGHTTVASNDVTSESSRRESANENLEVGGYSDERMIKDDTAEVPKEPQESPPEKNNPEPFASSEPSAVPEDGWGCDYSKEANTDDWGWGTDGEQENNEFTVDVDPPVNKANAPSSAAVQDSSMEESAYDLLQLSGQTMQQARVDFDNPSETRDMNVRHQNVNDVSNQLPHDLKRTGKVASIEESGTPGQDSISAAEAQQSSSREAGDSWPHVGDRDRCVHAPQETTLERVVSDSKHYGQPGKEGETDNDIHDAIEEDGWGIDVRSTDVDVSSTVAGTDVPSIAAQSSVDETEWESDRNESRLRAQNSADMAQNREEHKSAAPHVASSLLWSGHDCTSEKDRLWANPDAMWPSHPVHSQSPIVAKDEAIQAAYTGQEAAVETESLSRDTLLPKESASSHAPLIGKVDESSLRPVVDPSLSGGTTEFSQIELEKFEKCHEGHSAVFASMNNVLYDDTETQATEGPGRTSEDNDTPEESGINLLERQDNVQSFPQAESVAGAQNPDSSYSQMCQSSNAYWTERLDKSRTQRPDTSNDNMLFAVTDLQGTKSGETHAQTPVALSDRLKLTADDTLEKNVANVPLIRNFGPSEPIERHSASVPGSSGYVSRPSGDLESDQVPEPASPVGPVLEAPLEASLAENGTMKAESPTVHATADFHEFNESSDATDGGIGSRPTSNDRSRSIQVTQNLEWPAEEVACGDGDGSNYFENVEEDSNNINKRALQSNATHDEGPVLEHANSETLHGDNSSSSHWNPYAPRLSSSRAQNLPPEPAAVGSPPPPPAEQPSEEQQQNGSRPETVSYGIASYDPFSVSQDDSTVKPTTGSYDAFDWNIGVQESVFDAQVSLPNTSAVPEVGTVQSAGGPLKHVPAEKATEPDAVQVNFSQKDSIEEAPALEVQPDSHVSSSSQAAGDYGKHIAEREVPSSGGGQGLLSSYIQGPRSEQGDEEDKRGLSPNSKNPPDDMPLPGWDMQRPLNESSGLDRYAPRGVQPVQSTSDTLTKDPSSFAGREPFDAPGIPESSGNFPYIPASTELTLSGATLQEDHTVSGQSLRPATALPRTPNVSYASVEALEPPSTSDGFGDIQSRQREPEASSQSSLGGAVLTPEPMLMDHPAATRPPLPVAPDLAIASETPDSSMPKAVKPETKDWGQNPREYQEDHGRHQTNGLSYEPFHNRSHRQTPHKGGIATTDFKQHLLFPYNAAAHSASFSETRQTSSSPPRSPQAAFGNLSEPLPSQGRSDVATPRDTFMQAQGSYGMSAELDLGSSIPAPPQQGPLPPPPIPSHQEVFPAESIMDPSTFSYPYSILDTETSGNISYRPQRPLVSWGFGGKLVTIIPPANRSSNSTHLDDRVSAQGKGSSTVYIHDLTEITQDGSNDDWAAAAEAVSPLSLPVRRPDLMIYADMCDRLSKLSVGLCGSESEGRAAMWRILALLCRQGTSDWRINASTAICGPSSVPLFGKNDSSSLLSGKSHIESPLRRSELASRMSEVERGEAAAEVERLLTLGNGVEAIRVAQEAGLWPIALVLAATIDKSLYMKAVSEFAKSSLHDGSALQTLCLSTAEDESEILSKATCPSGLKEWRKTVGMLLTTCRAAPNTGEGQHARFLRLIDQIGDALIKQRNDVVAGHVCFLLSGRLGPLGSPNIPLLGADPKLPAGRPRSMGSPAVVLQSLVLEAVANAQDGARYPHILPFRLLLAEEVCSVGRPEAALAHCESISSAVREVFESGRNDISSKLFTLPFLSRLESLEQRLRVHLGIQEVGEKKGGLSTLGKSLSSVFTRSSTADSRNTQVTSRESPAQAAHFAGSHKSPQLKSTPFTSASPPLPMVSSADPQKVANSQWTPQLQSAAFTSASPPLPMVPSVDLPQHGANSQWTPEFKPSQLQPLPVDQSSRDTKAEAQSGDVSGNERWNSLVSKTIGFIAPAEGDLSPPLKARGDQGVPFHAQPTPLGLGTGTGSRHPSHDAHVGHMRSASVGDVPMMQSQGPMIQDHGRGNFSHPVQHGSQNQSENPYDSGATRADQAFLSGVPVQKETIAESGVAATHRRSASDMTFESQTSEKKPPRPPKKSSGLPQGLESLPKKEKPPVVKGWRSRLSEKIRAAFSGPPRAHMGVENKFRFDKERGRWVIEGEDPNEDDDLPPPPPDDDAMIGKDRNVPYSQSYESLPNPDLQFMPHSQVADSPGADGVAGGECGGGSGPGHLRRYSYTPQLGYNGSIENPNSRDTESESSVASAASAPVPYSSQAGIPMSANRGNKFRAHPGRLSGRRAYVDTFNKGPPATSISATASHPTRPGIPHMPAIGSTGASGYQIFTPSPAISSEGLSTTDSTRPASGVPPGTSGVVESSDEMHQMHQETQTSNGHQQRDSFGYGLSKDAPTPSIEQYQANTRNDHQPRLMA